MSFEIREASISDLNDIVDIGHLAMQDDPVYTRMFRDVSIADEREYSLNIWAQKFGEPDVFKMFKIVDLSSGQTVGWTGLDFPHVAAAGGEAASVTRHQQQPPERPDGIHSQLADEFFGVLTYGMAKENGYDAEVDYCRSGTRVLPAYQRKGLATKLSKHCSEIADRHGRRIFITARPAAVRLCEKTGFRKIAQHEIDMAKYDGVGVDVTTLMVRDSLPIQD